MSSLLDSKARRIKVLLDDLRERTKPMPFTGNGEQQLRGARSIGCPLIDALESAHTRLADKTFFANSEQAYSGAERAALNEALDVLLSELEERLLHPKDPHAED